MTHADACKFVMQWLSECGCRFVTLRPVGQFVPVMALTRWLNTANTLLFLKDSFRRLPRLKIGVTGEADVQAILPPHGRAVGVEVKVGLDTPSAAQLHWREKFTEAGGIYCLAHFGDVDEAKARIKCALHSTELLPAAARR